MKFLKFILFYFLIFSFFNLTSLYSQDINQILNQASELISRGENQAAVSLCEDLLKKYSFDENLKNKIFSLYRQWNLLQAEIERLENLKNTESNNIMPYKRLAEIYLWDNKELDALRELEILVSIEPNDKDAWIKLAKIYRNNQWFSEAINALNSALKTNPKSPEILIQLGDTYFSKGEIDIAKSFWRSAVNFDIENTNSYTSYAELLRRNGLYLDAVNIYEEGRRHFNDENLFADQLSLLYESQMQYLQAVEEYVKVFFSTPNVSFDSHHWTLDKISEIFKKEPLIQNDIINILSRYNENENIKKYMLELYFLKGDYISALNISRELSVKKNDGGDILLNYGDILLKNNKYEPAISFFQEGINLFPDGKNLEKFILLLGNTYKLSSKTALALDSFNKLISKFSNTCETANALYNRGNILNEQDKLKEAENDFINIIERFKNCPIFNSTLVKVIRLKIKLNELTKAEELTKFAKTQNTDKTTLDEIEFLEGKIKYFESNFKEALSLFEKNLSNYNDTFTNDAVRYILIIKKIEKNQEFSKQFSTGELLIEQNKLKDAKSIFSELATTNENSQQLKNLAELKLGEIDILEKDFDSAINLFNNIVNNSDDEELSAYCLITIAEIYEKNDKIKESLKTYIIVIDKFPLTFWANYSRNKIIKLSSNQ